MSLLNSLTLFVVLIIVYQIIISVFTILFRFTGLPQEKARFQVVSILTSCGFTTGESELFISSPRRRKLARRIMLFGYAFTVTIMSALVNVFLSFNSLELQMIWWELSLPLLTLIIIELIGKHPWVKRQLNKYIEKFAEKIMFGNNANRIFLLDYAGKNAIAEVHIKKVPKEFENISLRHSGLRENHRVLVILLERTGREAEKVRADDIFRDGDRLIVCGNYASICKAFEADERDLNNDNENRSEENE